MSTLTCPHCGKPIELVGQKELSEEYGIGPNPVQHARTLGLFPTPVLAFGNRNMWFKTQIDEYVEARSQERIEKLVAEFERTLETLPASERTLAAKQAAERLAGKK